MYIIEYDNFTLLPLAYNEFCNDIESLIQPKEYAGAIEIERIIDSSTFENIVAYCNKDKKILYVIDMRDIISYENKIFKKLLECTNAKIIIINIQNSLFESIKEDLNNEYIEIDNKTLCSRDDLKNIYEKLCDEIYNIYHNETIAIVHWMKQNVTQEKLRDIKPLDSSGVYCNMYINAKRLFIDPDKYCFVIYQMISMIIKSGCKFDALVSASRNGANIASVIGWLLNKKVIHCTSLGPKFSLGASSGYKDVRKNKKYIYIFDFMCLGTEAKLLNALLSYKGASLVEGYGIANYIDFEDSSKFSVLNKMRSLVDVQRENVGYRIAGSKKEIEDMLIKENKDYVFGVHRV